MIVGQSDLPVNEILHGPLTNWTEPDLHFMSSFPAALKQDEAFDGRAEGARKTRQEGDG